MTEGGKDPIKKRGDHNWDMERMQFEKERGNVSSANDYVNLETKTASVQEAMGSNSGSVPTTGTDKITVPYNKGQKTWRKKRTAKTSSQLLQFYGCS
jgi:hypothetical protein